MPTITGIHSGHIVQSVGQIDIMFAHPRIMIQGTYGGLCYLGGYRLQGEFLNLSQIVDNSVMVPILGGGSVQLTNNNNSCTMTFSTIRTGSLNEENKPIGLDENGYPVESGGYYDIVSLADHIKQISGGDDVGGSFKVQMGFNGMIFVVKLLKCTLVRSNPLILNGNDVPTYQTVFNCGRVITEGSEFDASNVGDDIAGR
jgi:hypothetical protein